MREAIGGTWLFQIVIVFILLFTGFMCLSINRSKAFNVKNYILETLQSHNGEKNQSIKDVVEYMKSNSYRTVGVKPDSVTYSTGGRDCTKKKPVADYTCYNREGEQDNHNPVFCLATIPVDNNTGCLEADYTELPSMYYYRIAVFYQLDLPVFHDLFNFTITGDTKMFLSHGDVR